MAFATNILSPIPALRSFGIFMAVCIVSGFLQCLLLWPVVLFATDCRKRRREEASKATAAPAPRISRVERARTRATTEEFTIVERLMYKQLGHFAFRFRFLIIIVFILIVAFAGYTCRLLKITTEATMFSPEPMFFLTPS